MVACIEIDFLNDGKTESMAIGVAWPRLNDIFRKYVYSRREFA